MIDRRALTDAIAAALAEVGGKPQKARGKVVELLRKALADGRAEIDRRLMERPGAGHDSAEA